MKSITIKLTLAFLAISALTISMVVIVNQRVTNKEFNTYLLDLDRSSITEHFVTYYQENGSWQQVNSALPGLYQSLKMPISPEYPPPFILTDPTYRVIVGSGIYHPGDILLIRDQVSSLPIIVGEQAVGYLDIRSPVPRPGPNEPSFLDRVNRLMIESGVIAILIALIFGIFISRFFTRPLRELTLAAREVSKGNLDHRVKVRSADELGELARVFNEMTDKLRNAMDSRKQMTADIAHELRTPISVILGHAEGIHDGVLPSNQETIEIIREESIRLNHLVDDLRTLSLTDAGELRLNQVRCNPNTLVTEVHDLFQYQASVKGITLEMDVGDKLEDISVDLNRMVQVFSNLMDNAIRSTPSGGTIRLSGKMVDNDVILGVHDTGKGIPEGDLEKIFDRLYRTDQARIRDNGGSGLGLAIARSIVEQHNGSIWAESKIGHGTSILIRLPVSG